jgi:stress-induced morphogen
MSDEQLRTSLATSIHSILHPDTTSDSSTTTIDIDIEGSCTVGEAKVTLSIISDVFVGMSRLNRQKLINKACSSFLCEGGGVHALTMKCRTVSEAGKE